MIEFNEMLYTIRDVAERLNSLGIDYMVTGSVAMGVYVPARTTYDVDIVMEIREEDAQRIEDKFSGDYYVDVSSIRDAVQRQSMFSTINNNTLIKVDCIVRKRDRLELEKFSRKERIEVGGIEFRVISKEDLIFSKLKWASHTLSSRQFEDVDRLFESGIDEGSFFAKLESTDYCKFGGKFQEWKTQAER
jgi:predicted nucleotidyltransferase